MILWDAKTRRKLRTLPTQWPGVQLIMSHPIRNELAILQDDALTTWDVANWRKGLSSKVVLPKPRSATGLDFASIRSAVAMSGDWSSIAYGFQNGDVEVVPRDGRQPPYRSHVSDNMVLQLAFSPDGLRLAAWANLDKHIAIWNLRTRRLEGERTPGERFSNVHSLAFSRNYLAAYLEGLGPRLWRIAPGAAPDLAQAGAAAWTTAQVWRRLGDPGIRRREICPGRRHDRRPGAL